MKYQSIKFKALIEKKSLFIILIFCILNLGHLAHSAILIKPSFGISHISHKNDFLEYRSYQDGNFSGNDLQNPTARSLSIIGNLGIYFKFDAGFFAGVTYDMNFIKINNYIHINTSGLGVTFGYMHSGWYVNATYLFFVTGQHSLRQDFESNRINYNPINSGINRSEVLDLSLNKGMGAIIQLGYVYFFSDMIGIGPSVQARTFLFSEIICTQGAQVDCQSLGGGGFGSNLTSFNNRQIHRSFDISLSLDLFFKI